MGVGDVGEARHELSQSISVLGEAATGAVGNHALDGGVHLDGRNEPGRHLGRAEAGPSVTYYRVGSLRLEAAVRTVLL